LGSETRVERIGSETRVERIGSETRVERIGSETRLERIGSETRVERIGSETRLERIRIGNYEQTRWERDRMCGGMANQGRKEGHVCADASGREAHHLRE
jgi:hypothetical protein